MRPRNNKYEICEGQGRYEALKNLKKSKVPVIIKNYTVEQGCEVALAGLFLRTNVSSKERELGVWKRYKTGKYKTYRELGTKIGLTGERVSNLIWCKETRDKTNGTLVSSETLLATKNGFTDDERIKFCKLVELEKIPARDVRDAARFLRTCSEEQKLAILNNDIPYDKAKQVIEQRKPLLQQLYKKVADEYNKKETIKKIIEKESYRSSDVLRLLMNFLKELEPIYIENISDETEKKQEISNLIIATGLLLRFLHKISVIDNTKYNSILRSIDLSVKDIEMVKEDGHNYRLLTEWKTPFEEKIKQKEHRLKTSKKEPVLT